MIERSRKPKRTGRPVEHIQLRLTVFASIFVVFFVIIFGRLWFLQVMAGEKYALLAEENRLREISLDSIRGSIYDCNDVLLVGNRPTLVVAASPSVMRDKKTLNKLSDLLELPVGEITKTLSSKKVAPLKPVVIKENVDQKTIALINEYQADFPGVEARAVPVREYPQGSLSAHVVGYLGRSGRKDRYRKEV